jgi:hypothetical protein
MPFSPATRAEWVLFSQFIQAEPVANMTGPYRAFGIGERHGKRSLTDTTACVTVCVEVHNGNEPSA